MRCKIILYTEYVFFTLHKSIKCISYRLSTPRLNFLSLVFGQCVYKFGLRTFYRSCEHWELGQRINMSMWRDVKSQATTVYFRLGKLRRVSTYVQHVWGIIGHVTVEAGNTVGTDGTPPQVAQETGLGIFVSSYGGLISYCCKHCTVQRWWSLSCQNFKF
jgi:hypothetical protein